MVVLSALGPSCSCGPKTSSLRPVMQVLDANGNSRTAVDFGRVQVGVPAQQRVRVRNAGGARLTVSAATFTDAAFTVAAATPLPLTVEAGEEAELGFSFLPSTAEVRVTAEATLASDDPATPTLALSLSGTGIAAVATLMPKALAFGEVYVGEKKTLSLSLTNAGTDVLTVSEARWSSNTPASLSGDLTPFKGALASGQTVSAQLSFAPGSPDAAAGTLELVLGGGLGTAVVPLTGQGIQAAPALCFRLSDTDAVRCADSSNTVLTVDFGSLCEARFAQTDGGGVAGCHTLDGGTALLTRKGSFFVRNSGNTVMTYSLQFQSQLGAGCDGGSTADFTFSNAPERDGGITKWVEPTTSLPMQVTDPTPWETAPQQVTYTPHSACPNDTADQARVTWLRDDATHAPLTLSVAFVGRSLLPAGVGSDISIAGATPVSLNFLGVLNRGSAPLRVRSAELWQGEALPDGGRGATPFERCANATSGDCAVFAWQEGHDPATVLPLTLDGTPLPDLPTSAVLGRLTFGPTDAGVMPQQGTEYRVFSVVETDDPYTPTVVSTVRARKTQ